MRLASHAGAGLRSMASHGGGGGWPGGAGGLPPGPLGGAQSLFGDGSYSGNIIQGGSVLQPVNGVLTITAAAMVAPDADTGASVVLCDTLIIDGGWLKPSTNSKGLIVFAKTKVQLLNGGTCHINYLGKAGNFGNLTAYDLTPNAFRGKLKKSALEAYVVQGEGAAGATCTYTDPLAGATGAAATAMQSGGGGTGGGGNGGGWGKPGFGGKGGPCCGGAGGGGGSQVPLSAIADAGAAYGGPGGNAGPGNTPYSSGGGAGDTPGLNGTGGAGSPGAGGGVLMLFSPAVSVGSGCSISSAGATGGSPNGATSGCGGGGAGGGVVVIATSAGGYANLGTVAAPGGAGGPYTTGGNTHGGAGGAGSVNIFTIS